MNVFIRVNGELRKYTASDMPHGSAIEAVTDTVNQEIRVSGNRSIALALIQGGKKEELV